MKECEDGMKECEDGMKECEDGMKECEDGMKECEDGWKFGMKNYLLQYLHSDDYSHRSYTICTRTLIGLLCSSSSSSCSASLSRSSRWVPHFSTLVSSLAFRTYQNLKCISSSSLSPSSSCPFFHAGKIS